MAIDINKIYENLDTDKKRYKESKKIKESQNKDNIFIHDETGLKFEFKPLKIDVYLKNEKITFIPLTKNGLGFKSKEKTDRAKKFINENTSLDKEHIENAIIAVEEILLERAEDSYDNS